MPTSSTRARIALYVVLAFVILAGVSSALAQWRASEKDAAAKTAQEQSDEVSRCLTGFRLEYVDAPAERSREKEKIVLELVARGELESPAFVEAVDEFAAIKSDVEAFEDLNRQARKDPAAFLRVCRARNP
jgi:hypothetical protein